MIILSLPYYTAQAPELPEDVDLIEYRLDYCQDASQIDFSNFSDKHILTWRGLNQDSPYLPKMLNSKALVDLDVCEYHKAHNLDKIIVSLHLAEYKEDRIIEFLRFPYKAFALKIVFEAKSFEEIVRCSHLIAQSGRRVIFNVNGKWAAFQRSLYRHFNSLAVYLFNLHSTYPGQLSLEDYRLIAGNGILSGSQIFGIIGGAQVNSSLSLKHYNRLFAGSDRHYLPIPAASPQEAISVLNWLKTKFSLRAFSITAPFKRGLPLALEHTDAISNTLLFSETGELNWYNTDLIALAKCLQNLQINANDSILIYGSGDCAEAFLSKLQSMAYKILYLDARNPITCKILRDKYQLPHNVPHEVNVLINTSSGLEFCGEPGKSFPFFEKLIELPYSVSQTSTLCEYAKANGLPYIDGVSFFELQFKAQKSLIFPQKRQSDEGSTVIYDSLPCY